MTASKAPIKAPKNHMFRSFITILFAGMCVFLFSSCEQAPTSREYEEIVTAPATDPHAFMRSVPFAGEKRSNSSLSWEVPQGWSEEKGSGIRLVTFRAVNGTIECSIVSLGGQAGGLRSNVTRWMGQINGEIPADDQFDAYLSRSKILKTKGGFSMTIIDLSEFVSNDNSPSMISAIAELKELTLFVKMTGSRSNVALNHDQFISLIKSLVF